MRRPGYLRNLGGEPAANLIRNFGTPMTRSPDYYALLKDPRAQEISKKILDLCQKQGDASERPRYDEDQKRCEKTKITTIWSPNNPPPEVKVLEDKWRQLKIDEEDMAFDPKKIEARKQISEQLSLISSNLRNLCEDKISKMGKKLKTAEGYSTRDSWMNYEPLRACDYYERITTIPKEHPELAALIKSYSQEVEPAKICASVEGAKNRISNISKIREMLKTSKPDEYIYIWPGSYDFVEKTKSLSPSMMMYDTANPIRADINQLNKQEVEDQKIIKQYVALCEQRAAGGVVSFNTISKNDSSKPFSVELDSKRRPSPKAFYKQFLLPGAVLLGLVAGWLVFSK